MKKQSLSQRIFDDIFLQEFPKSLAAERAVLASMLVDGSCIPDVLAKIDSDCFNDKRNISIFTAIKKIYGDGNTLEPVMVDVECTATKDRDYPGLYYIIDLVESVPSSANVMYYVDKLYDFYLRKKFIVLAYSQSTLVQNLEITTDEAVEKLLDAMPSIDHRASEDIGVSVEKWREHLGLIKKGLRGITFGVEAIDSHIGGFLGGELVIIAGRPSTGKTSLGFQMANTQSVHGAVPGGIFSLEMSSDWIPGRMAAQNLNIDLFKLSRCLPCGVPDDVIESEYKIISDSPLYVCDNPTISVGEMMALAIKWKVSYDIKYLLVDYLQLITSFGESDASKIANASRELKKIARKLNIPVIVLSQLRRFDAYANPDKSPGINDLKGSGAIEADADTILITHRKLGSDEATIIIGKQRNGPVGEVNVHFMNESAKFV